MARPTKKKSSAKKSAARKRRPGRKIRAKKARRREPASRQTDSKRSARGTKAARPSAKSRRESTESPAILLGLNHREKKLDPFMHQQKQKLLQLRDAMVDSMAGEIGRASCRERGEREIWGED